jgi:hypothetical protein
VVQDGQTVTVEWKDRDATAKILLDGDTANWVSLRSSGGGLYRDLCKTTPSVFKAHGIRRYIMSPADDTARDILLKHGDWKLAGRTWEWVL